MTEKNMPHNLDAEKSVLGSMLIAIPAADKALENLTSDLFYFENNQYLFESMKRLKDSGNIIDTTTLLNELNRQKLLEKVGGPDYLSELINFVPSASNIDEYIKIVKDKATLRRLIDESSRILDDAYDDSNSINDILDSAESNIMNVVKTRQGSDFRSIREVLSKTQENLEKLALSDGEITGISTGFTELDRLTAGFHEHEMIIIAARPAMGKTAFALNLAVNMATATDKAVLLFNMEMGAEQLAVRMIAAEGQIQQDKLKKGQLSDEDWKKVNEAICRLGETNLYIDDTAGMTMGDIRAKCRKLSNSKEGLAAVIIDYLTLIQGSAKFGGNRQQEVSEISRSLKTMAMELDIPVIALAQLSRSVEQRDDKRPMLSDLRESGSIEQDADIVSFLYRDDYYTMGKLADENPTSKSEFIVAKHRNGSTMTIPMIFQKDTSTFFDCIEEENG